MPNIITPNHAFTLPEVGAAKDAWGTLLNANFATLDTLLSPGAGGIFAMRHVATEVTKQYTFSGASTSRMILGQIGTAPLYVQRKTDDVVTHAIHGADVTSPAVASAANSIITRQMGDARYATLVGLNSFTGTGSFRGNAVAEVHNGVSNANAHAFQVNRKSDGAVTHAIPQSDVTDPATPSNWASILTRQMGDGRYARMAAGNQFRAAQLIDMVTPRIHFRQAETPNPYSYNTCIGVFGGDFMIVPANANNSVQTALGYYEQQRNASGVLAHVFRGFDQNGFVGLCQNGLSGRGVFSRSGTGAVQMHAGSATLQIGGPDSASATAYIYVVNGLNAPVFRVAPNGGTTNLTGAYGTISDRRLKENIAPASPQLSDVLALEVVNYDLKEGGDRLMGFVAQDVRKVKPGLVDEDEEGILSVKTSVLIPILVKALQELHAEVADLRAAVTGV